MSNAPENPRKALGKGLSSLLPGRPAAPAVAAAPPPPSAPAVEIPVNKLPIHAIEPNPTQPRSVFDAAKLAELSPSIRANGIIQPLIVRKIGETYHLIARERRWREAKLTGQSADPVVDQELCYAQVMEVELH